MLFLAKNYTKVPYEQLEGVIAKKYLSLARLLKPYAQQGKITLSENGAYVFTTIAPRLRAVLDRIEIFSYDLCDAVIRAYPEASFVATSDMRRVRNVKMDSITPETGNVLVSTYVCGFTCDDLQFIVYITVTYLGAKIPNCDTIVSVNLIIDDEP